MKSIVRALGIAGLSTCFATAALAGGFSYGSSGGNWGKWSYTDGEAFGGADVSGFYYGETSSTSQVETGATQSSCYYCTSSVGSGGIANNTSSFHGTYGSAQSHSGIVSGSGIGDGHGFKSGFFHRQ